MKIFQIGFLNLSIFSFVCSVSLLGAADGAKSVAGFGDWIDLTIDEIASDSDDGSVSSRGENSYIIEKKLSGTSQPVRLWADKNGKINTIYVTDKLKMTSVDEYIKRYYDLRDTFLAQSPDKISVDVRVLGRLANIKKGVDPSDRGGSRPGLWISTVMYFDDYFVVLDLKCSGSPFGESDLLEVLPIITIYFYRSDTMPWFW